MIIIDDFSFIGFWGLGIGDWGLGIGDWGLGIGPDPQSPIPNPQSPIPILVHYFLYIIFIPYNDYCNCISPTTESINCSISHKRKILLFYLQKKLLYKTY